MNDLERWASRVAQIPPRAFTHSARTRKVPRRIRTFRILRSLHPAVKGRSWVSTVPTLVYSECS